MGKPRVTSLENQYTAEHERKEHNRQSHRKRLTRRLTAFFIVAAVVSSVLISSMVTQASVLEDKQTERAQLEQKIVELDKQEENLRNEIVKLNDDEYIAKLARRDYFLSDSGEIIFTIPEDQPAAEKEQNDTAE
ncbi:FtsB family cell division protein [Jeotgalibacillus haloalkalitolerans]|uniref:Septum formation initiator family protein n=1 Tax=Jeotgalibacillus haloalkalitolerans TaxID=3104292 RepID=A0ABU5KS77_9BACL|nr:septum formation initiator family protein [Jeotgalibacillus sp. HH7-29]MDZ5713801.1 septum formation initiator family protein [Jeotgalibacillus sp. HH7-29]